MAEKIQIDRRNWRLCRKALEGRFEKPIPPDFQRGDIELESLMRFLTPAESDHIWRGRILIGLELRAALSNLPGNEAAEIDATTPLDGLFPRKNRKKRWQELQDSMEWKLPRIGMPVWAQYLWGAVLLVGFVMMFVFPLWGLLVFFGGIILSFQVEKRSIAFQYPTVDATVNAMVRLNWPALEMGADGDDRLRMAFAEVLDRHFVPIGNSEAAFPGILVEDPFLANASQWHILNGDALRTVFDEAEILNERVMIRECYVVGPLPENDRSWKARAEFIRTEYQASVEKYRDWVLEELDKLQSIPEDAEINLWFEDDLFCQVNLWFVIARLHEFGRTANLFRVFPLDNDDPVLWNGFQDIDESGLCNAMSKRLPMQESDIKLALALWKAFKANDVKQLQELSKSDSNCFRKLAQVVQAHSDRFPTNGGLGRPHLVLQEILVSGKTEFEAIFEEFNRREGIYGFGELQVKSMLRDLTVAIDINP